MKFNVILVALVTFVVKVSAQDWSPEVRACAADLNCRALHSLWKSCLELGGASHGTTTVQDCLCIYEAPLVYSPDISTSMSQCLSCFSPLSPAYSNVTYLEGCAADDFCANRGVDTDAAEFTATASQIAEENDFPLILPDAIYIGNPADLETPTKAARDVNSTGVAAEVACLDTHEFQVANSVFNFCMNTTFYADPWYCFCVRFNTTWVWPHAAPSYFDNLSNCT